MKIVNITELYHLEMVKIINFSMHFYNKNKKNKPKYQERKHAIV